MSLLEFDQQYGKVIGIDEAGRGPLAGAVVSAAVYVVKPSALLEVNDSKKLSAKKREYLFDVIKDSCKIGIGIVSEEIIDKINILEATKVSMELALKDLNEEGIALVDGNVPIKGSIAIIKGDQKSLSIAAASIIAKVTRDRIMEKEDLIYPEYNFKKHKGYGTKEHIENIQKYGICKIHRRSFLKNVDKQSKR